MVLPQPVLQTHLPHDQKSAASRGLPGMQPLAETDWIVCDDAYSAQLRLKADLLANRRADILQSLPGSEEPLEETLNEVMSLLDARDGFDVTQTSVRRPDDVTVPLNLADPLATLSMLIQEDICILQKQGDEHVLTAALLTFPASWTLAEKIGRPLIRIHRPVPDYDANVAARVQRLFNGVQVGRPLWRANLFPYVDPSLHHPRPENQPRRDNASDARFVRSERQTVLRLPKTKAVVFAIHTNVTQAKDGQTITS